MLWGGTYLTFLGGYNPFLQVNYADTVLGVPALRLSVRKRSLPVTALLHLLPYSRAPAFIPILVARPPMDGNPPGGYSHTV